MLEIFADDAGPPNFRNQSQFKNAALSFRSTLNTTGPSSMDKNKVDGLFTPHLCLSSCWNGLLTFRSDHKGADYSYQLSEWTRSAAVCAETNGRPVCGLLVFAASMDALCAAGQNENIQKRVCLECTYSVWEL